VKFSPFFNDNILRDRKCLKYKEEIKMEIGRKMVNLYRTVKGIALQHSGIAAARDARWCYGPFVVAVGLQRGKAQRYNAAAEMLSSPTENGTPFVSKDVSLGLQVGKVERYNAAAEMLSSPTENGTPFVSKDVSLGLQVGKVERYNAVAEMLSQPSENGTPFVSKSKVEGQNSQRYNTLAGLKFNFYQRLIEWLRGK
jgi:hypothetical protein